MYIDDGDIYLDRLGDEHDAEYEYQSQQTNRCQHGTARNLATQSAAQKTSAHHHEPIYADHRTCNCRAYPAEVRHVEVSRVGDTHLDTYIEEDGYGAKNEVTERHGTVLVLLHLAALACSLLLGSLHVRLGNIGQADDDEGQSEDGHGDDHRGSRITYARILDRAADKISQQDGGYRTADRVARTTELDKLVTAVAAAAQSVEHGVNHDVEHTHRETCNEGSKYVYPERLHIARKELYADADETDRNGSQ